MKKALTAALAAAAVLTSAAACASSPAPASTPTRTPTPAPTSAPAVAATGAASSHARLLVDALASGTSASALSASSLVAGPVMTHYISFQATYAEAAEAAGQPERPSSVTVTGANSYQLCYPQSTCQSFTAFQSDAAGRIVGMQVDGQPVAGRIAAGRNDRGNGLVLTDVTSYLFTSTGQVGVAFRVRNNGNSGVSTDGFLPVFVTSGGARLSPDLSSSVMRSTDPLGPGNLLLPSPSSTRGP
jgi:hypothetical protein